MAGFDSAHYDQHLSTMEQKDLCCDVAFDGWDLARPKRLAANRRVLAYKASIDPSF
jgi:hypothetical protein